MHLLRAVVSSSLPRPGVRDLLVASLAITVALLFAPTAPTQEPAKKANQAVATVQPLPQSSTASAENDRITELAQLQTPSRKGDYVLNNGDLVGVEVFDVPELSRDVRISETGLVSLPLLPVSVRAAGLTAFQLQDKLAEVLTANGLVSNPHITVSVKEQHGQPITIMGAVRTPMVIEAARQMSLLEALSRAGGIADDAAGHVLITHATALTVENLIAAEAQAPAPASVSADPATTTPSEPAVSEASLTTRVSLTDLLESGDPKYNIQLRGGDVVSVPRAGVVYAVGAVQRPGGFVMASDRQQLTVLKVLALSGGLTPTAKQKSAVIIRQSAESTRQEVPVDLGRILAFKAADPLLLQSDILFVPNSGGKSAMGKVAQTALGLAGGVALVRLGGL